MKKGSELGISRCFLKPLIKQENKAKNKCNIYIDKELNKIIKDTDVSEDHPLQPMKGLDTMRIIDNLPIKIAQEECKNETDYKLFSNTKDIDILNDSESVDEPHQYPPQRIE